MVTNVSTRAGVRAADVDVACCSIETGSPLSLSRTQP